MKKIIGEPIAGIVLAAGSATRLGKPKQLLDWRGQPLVRAVARVALEAKLSPVLVVTGYQSALVAKAVEDLPIVVVNNPDWEQGQSTSIHAALNSLPLEVCAAIFLLVDQPHVSPVVLRALVKHYRCHHFPIIAPMVNGQRTTPVLMDRSTFPELLNLRGDVGGRAIFSKCPPSFLIWQDESLLEDIDTFGDYERLKGK